MRFDMKILLAHSHQHYRCDYLAINNNKFYITIIKSIRCTNFSNLFFGMKLYVFQIVPLSIIRSFSLYTQQWYMLYNFCWQLARKLSAEGLWHIPLVHVQWKTPDDGQRNYLKHVEFYSKNKFENLVHLIDFIIRIYHDARSHERQNNIHCKIFI
jgi:hypothetical protein